jgi:hypothetical protein
MLTTLITTVTLTVGLSAMAAPAHAATGWDRCPSGYSCYFSGTDGQGSIWLAPSPGWWNLPFKVVSVWNRGGGQIGFYIGYTFTGWTVPIGYKGSNGALAANRIYIVG